MSLPDDMAPGVPEKVDNTNAIHRRLVEELLTASDVDTAAVVETMISDGTMSPIDVETAVKKAWISRKRADDAVKAYTDIEPVKEPVEKPVEEPVEELLEP